ncbi:hypothetical protein [uncultured Formosa sp.]|uniref:hypothetical protein n=1 Tax=uncultured Formosa sp. TaxID=255435 RepID=UPI0026273899|nr:hypothetical protein [uncultured Formosa sp.]
MKKKLFQDLFTKAEKQSGKNTKHGLSSHLENIFIDDLKFPVNKITFVRYFEKYIEGSESITNNPNTELLNTISKYLHYNSYEDYVSKHDLNIEKEILVEDSKKDNIIKNTTPKTNKPLNILKTHKWTFLIATMLCIGFISFHITNKEHWMVWQGDHYIESEFDTERFNLGQLKLYNKDRIHTFRKVEVNCETIFFNKNGKVKIWYGKNLNKELEYFTSYGLHPETGKTLDPITKYMINKYACKKQLNIKQSDIYGKP